MNNTKVRISLEVSEYLADQIKELAKKKDISINALIRLALIEYLNIV